MFRAIGKIAGGLVLIGLGIALLNAFNWDLFGLIGWLWAWFSGTITSISDFFSGNATFQKVVSAPPS